MSLDLEKRVAQLEEQVARLVHRESAMPPGREWVDDLYGKFKGDPAFKQAMELGRKYRESLRPTARKRKSKK
jgi:hypothetical protein